MRDDEDLKRVAKARVDHMPAETAGGRIDESAAQPADTGDSAAAGPQEGEGQPTAASDSDQ